MYHNKNKMYYQFQSSDAPHEHSCLFLIHTPSIYGWRRENDGGHILLMHNLLNFCAAAFWAVGLSLNLWYNSTDNLASITGQWVESWRNIIFNIHVLWYVTHLWYVINYDTYVSRCAEQVLRFELERNFLIEIAPRVPMLEPLHRFFCF